MELSKRENVLKRIRPFYQDSSFIKVISRESEDAEILHHEID